MRRGIEKNDKEAKNDETPTGKEDDVEMVEVVNEGPTSRVPSSDLVADER